MPSITPLQHDILPAALTLAAIQESQQSLTSESLDDVAIQACAGALAARFRSREDLLTAINNKTNDTNTSFSTASITHPQTAQLPLCFDTLDQELNINIICELLHSAIESAQSSGILTSTIHDSVLEQHTGRGWMDLVRFGVIGMHISNLPLTGKQFTELSLSEVASLFDVPLSRDVPHHNIPGVTVSEHHELRKVAEVIHQTFKGTGESLIRLGVQHLAEFVVRFLTSLGSETDALVKIEKFVDAMVKNFDAFRDDVVVQGHNVFFFHRVQKLALNLHHLKPALLPLPQASQASDPHAPFGALIPPEVALSVLKATALLKQSDGNAVQEDVRPESVWKTRAALAVACHRVAQTARALGVARLDDVDVGLYFMSQV